MNLDDLFPSKYMKASDIGDDSLSLIMDEVRIEEMSDGKRKPVLYFQNADKGLVLNKTNGNIIGAVYGKDADGWSGHPVSLISVPVDYQGKTVDAIRVRVRSQARKPSLQAQPAQSDYAEAKGRAPVKTARTALEDDDLPF
jgi:hypothetical protein